MKELNGEKGVLIEPPRIRKPFDPSEDLGISTGPGLTKQSDKDACDVNLILKRYENTGVLPDMIRNDARYGDFSSPVSFQDSMNVVMKAQAQFEALSAKVRAEFDNDPAKMLAFCADEKNIDKMIELGLAIPKAPEAPKTEAKASVKEEKKA